MKTFTGFAASPARVIARPKQQKAGIATGQLAPTTAAQREAGLRRLRAYQRDVRELAAQP